MATAYLAPNVPGPDYGDPLDDLFHDAIQGITGIAAELIRPRWQPEPPNQPDFSTNWVSFGIMTLATDLNAFIRHDPLANGGLGGDVYETTEKIKVLHSFYGPGGMGLLARYRDGLKIAQNREALLAAKVKLTEVGDPSNLPVLLKEKWVTRVDVSVFFVRHIERVYAVPSVIGGSIGIDNEHYITQIEINQP
jgi:hypothetical protein